jgi:hypothetical protein
MMRGKLTESRPNECASYRRARVGGDDLICSALADIVVVEHTVLDFGTFGAAAFQEKVQE